MSIIISPFSRVLNNGKRNPKNFPYWDELIVRLKEANCEIIQIGYEGELKYNNVIHNRSSLDTIRETYFNHNYNHLIISVDNVIPHMAHYYKRQCAVIWGQSDPDIFGYKENINILKSRSYLRSNQFATWEESEYIEEAFPSAEFVFSQIKRLL